MLNWHKIEDFPPPHKELVLVTGPSGYVTHTRFIELAYIDEDYRPSHGGALRWIDVQNDALSEHGYTPTHWARQPNWPVQP